MVLPGGGGWGEIVNYWLDRDAPPAIDFARFPERDWLMFLEHAAWRRPIRAIAAAHDTTEARVRRAIQHVHRYLRSLEPRYPFPPHPGPDGLARLT